MINHFIADDNGLHHRGEKIKNLLRVRDWRSAFLVVLNGIGANFFPPVVKHFNKKKKRINTISGRKYHRFGRENNVVYSGVVYVIIARHWRRWVRHIVINNPICLSRAKVKCSRIAYVFIYLHTTVVITLRYGLVGCYGICVSISDVVKRNK